MDRTVQNLSIVNCVLRPVGKFKYLSSNITSRGHINPERDNRILGAALAAFGKL